MSKYYLHVIQEERCMVSELQSIGVPRVGDELRFHGEKYYKVTAVIWVFDEPECPMQRINIGVVDAPIEREVPK